MEDGLNGREGRGPGGKRREHAARGGAARRRAKRRLCLAKPWAEKYVLVAALALMLVLQAECPEAAFPTRPQLWGGTGLGSLFYGRVNGICVYLLAPAVLPRTARVRVIPQW